MNNEQRLKELKRGGGAQRLAGGRRQAGGGGSTRWRFEPIGAALGACTSVPGIARIATVSALWATVQAEDWLPRSGRVCWRQGSHRAGNKRIRSNIATYLRKTQ